MLTQTGDELVQTVIETLNVLGFKKVLDVDKSLKDDSAATSKMEDLQILDNELSLLVEVKGVNSLLSDEDALAVNKYVTTRMRELKSTEIKGLTIVNHQRHLPPLDRENEKPFRDIILTNAEEYLIGLLTTWELYKITRNFLKNNWKHENVKELFYNSGQITCLPSHYEYLGRVIGFIEDKEVVGIQIENSELKAGDRIAFDTGIEFEEQIAESLEINNESVEIAEVGKKVGLTTKLPKKQFKVNETKVFKVC